MYDWEARFRVLLIRFIPTLTLLQFIVDYITDKFDSYPFMAFIRDCITFVA